MNSLFLGEVKSGSFTDRFKCVYLWPREGLLNVTPCHWHYGKLLSD